MAWRPRDQGSTSAIGLSVAAGTFAISFVVANLLVQQPAAIDHSPVLLDSSASTALDLVVAQAGRSATGSGWLSDPDIISRFGLASDGEENFLDYVKIKSMRNGTMTHADNDAPDYSDVRAALGLTTGDFHLRTYPVLPGYDDPRWTKDPRGRFGYIAHDIGTSTPTGTATVTTTRTTVGNNLNVTVTIRNDGATPYIFAATIGLGKISTNGVLVEEERHTNLLAPGAQQSLHVEFPRMSYSPAPDGVRVTVADAAGRVINGPTWGAATTSSSGTVHTVGVKLAAGARYYLPTEQLKFYADRYDGTGATPNTAVNWRFVLVGPDNHEWYNNTLDIKKKKSASYDCANCTALGVYTGYFYDSGSPFSPTVRARDSVEVVSATPSSGLPTFSGIAGKEIELMGKLVKNFNPTLYDATSNPEGDVFDDASKVRVLPPLLPRYSTLIVGSGVEQNALNSGDIKWSIADWVINGGNLMVLGRESGQANWLEPVYKASIAGAGGGIGAPDPTHPMLTTPNRLDYKRYTDHGLAWGIRQDQPFTHVLTKGVSGSEREDALAVANPGAYNSGSVVLTSYMPGDLTSPQDDTEAIHLLQNMMAQGYNMLFLDYGPEIPENVPVGSAQRLAAVPHPNVPNAVVEVRVVMYTWS